MQTSILDKVINDAGIIEPVKLAHYFHTNVKEIASLSGISPNTLARTDRYKGQSTQLQLRACTEIINRVLPWCGNEYHAYAWYRSEGLPEFGGLTAEQLVKDGRIEDLRLYLNHLSEGGYA
ncbi:hypothetical protein [Vibrio agarivorans]|uniref:DUF2384 domain-containing protein n=1 Tax=Vibrio agarivorans TaxID=153622 RepID=A0ABT7Y5U6_9VIBR|nr:hypothetical protein [Vibrio agarivorans]MDN2483428.1 hypothetical protein [Vibrio agarivorans]